MPAGNLGLNVNYLSVMRRAVSWFYYGQQPQGIAPDVQILNGESILAPLYSSTQPTPASVPSGALALIGTDGTSGNVVVAPNGLTIPSGTTLTIASGGSFVDNSTTASITVTLAQLLALHTVGIQLVAAQGAGTLIEIISVVVDLIYGSAAYVGGGAVGVNYGLSGSAASTTIPQATFTGLAANTCALITGAIASVTSANCLNKAAVLQAAGADFTVGTGGTAVIQFRYKLHTGLS